MTTTDPRPTSLRATPREAPSAGPDTQAATEPAAPMPSPLPGSSTLNGHDKRDNQAFRAVEGQTSPQARHVATPISGAPAGTMTAPPAIIGSTPTMITLEGRKTSQDQSEAGTHAGRVLADNLPGGHPTRGAQTSSAAGGQAPVPAIDPPLPSDAAPVRVQTPPAQATRASTPTCPTPGLADPLLALAADILDDLEKVRIGNENRLRQLTRDQADTDGIERGFGLDATHPDVARLAALVQLLADAEHQATLNLQRSMRKHPLGAWVKDTKGIGEKQGARLIAAIGDPWWNDLHDRPRTLSELRAYCGYGEDREHPGRVQKRQRGQRANWSATAKMRAYLAAESCMKQRSSPYRAVYDATRGKYADATHATECARCGPKNSPAKPGSALSDGHKHARALRAVAKEILRDLWREAREIDGRTP